MERYEDVSEILNQYLKPILSFTLKRTKTVHEAEDLAQEIIIKVYKALRSIENIYNVDSYIWRIANNTVVNYYRSKSRTFVGINIDDITDVIKSNKESIEESYIKNEEINKLK